LLLWATGVIDVIAAASRRKEMDYMKTFTIDVDNAITAFATAEEAAAALTTPFESFASQKELAALAAKWPEERLVEIWNGLPGVEPVKSFKSTNTAAAKIWARIQRLGEPAKPKAKAKGKAKVGAQVATGTPAKGKSTKKATSGKKSPKAKKGAKQDDAAGPREGSKTAQVVDMLKRKNGATLEEIMEKMGWQKHTVRGFMAGAMKKAGYEVESFKSDKGERTYRINT
jgi:Protein of unknown function (DUF3489)